MKIGWAKVAALLGVAYCVVGFFLVFLGWNGAATYDEESAQIPYLISGGIAGLGLIVLGSALVVAHSLRTDRVELRAALDDLRAALERGARVGAAVSAGGASPLAGTADADSEIVLAGSDSYHRPGCTLIEGQIDLVSMTSEEAAAAGRTPCRICNPDTVAAT